MEGGACCIWYMRSDWSGATEILLDSGHWWGLVVLMSWLFACDAMGLVSILLLEYKIYSTI